MVVSAVGAVFDPNQPAASAQHVGLLASSGAVRLIAEFSRHHHAPNSLRLARRAEGDKSVAQLPRQFTLSTASTMLQVNFGIGSNPVLQHVNFSLLERPD